MRHRIAFIVAWAVLLGSPLASAQPADHLQCFKIKDPIKLKGVVALDAREYGLDPACKISKARMICIGAEKTLIEAFDRKERIFPLLLGGPEADTRVCYKVKCPRRKLPNPLVADQFGERTLEKLKTSMLCTPAVLP